MLNKVVAGASSVTSRLHCPALAPLSRATRLPETPFLGRKFAVVRKGCHNAGSGFRIISDDGQYGNWPITVRGAAELVSCRDAGLGVVPKAEVTDAGARSHRSSEFAPPSCTRANSRAAETNLEDHLDVAPDKTETNL